MFFKASNIVGLYCIIFSTTTLWRVILAFPDLNNTVPNLHVTTVYSSYEKLKVPLNLSANDQISSIIVSKGSIFFRPFHNAANKFRSDWKTYITIPFVAAAVGWLTSFLAINMIFYPIDFFGIDIYRPNGSPIGLIGWQGIVPTKKVKMSEKLVDLVLTQLLSVKELFSKLDPWKLAVILGPEIPKLTESIASHMLPNARQRYSVEEVVGETNLGVRGRAIGIASKFNRRFLVNFAKDVQANAEDCLDVKKCVVNQMVADG